MENQIHDNKKLTVITRSHFVESENNLIDGLHKLVRNFLKEIGELSNSISEFKSNYEKDYKYCDEELYTIKKEGEKISCLIQESDGKIGCVENELGVVNKYSETKRK